MMNSASLTVNNAGTTTTKKTMMVLMMVLNKVALLVKSLALTAHANVNMMTNNAGKLATSAGKVAQAALKVATMPTREMILTKEITEKIRSG